MNENNDYVKSDFAQLVIARKLIKELKFENGMLQSERDELKDDLEKLKAERDSITPAEIKQIKKESVLATQKDTINHLRKKIAELKKTNENLIIKNIQLQKVNN